MSAFDQCTEVKVRCGGDRGIARAKLGSDVMTNFCSKKWSPFAHGLAYCSLRLVRAQQVVSERCPVTVWSCSVESPVCQCECGLFHFGAVPNL